MARYFVHIRDGDAVFKDEVGRRFSDPEDAKALAAIVARGLAQDEAWAGYFVIIVDEHGTEIARVPVKETQH